MQQRLIVEGKDAIVLSTICMQRKMPGLPFGTAVQSGYFNINAPSVEPFLAWFRKTFILVKN